MKYGTYKNYRDKAKMTDYKVAKALKMTFSTLSLWKSGKTTPSQKTQSQIASLLKIPAVEAMQYD